MLDAASRTGTIAKARENKKLVGGYFSPDVRRSLHLLALEEGVTIQALLGEALDHLIALMANRPLGSAKATPLCPHVNVLTCLAVDATAGRDRAVCVITNP